MRSPVNRSPVNRSPVNRSPVNEFRREVPYNRTVQLTGTECIHFLESLLHINFLSVKFYPVHYIEVETNS